jgi:hypothetical protein
MDPLLEAISAQVNGSKWDESGLQLEGLCYDHDNALLTEDPKDMQETLEVVNECGLGLAECVCGRPYQTLLPGLGIPHSAVFGFASHVSVCVAGETHFLSSRGLR